MLLPMFVPTKLLDNSSLQTGLLKLFVKSAKTVKIEEFASRA